MPDTPNIAAIAECRAMLEIQRSAVAAEAIPSAGVRRQRLSALLRLLTRNKQAIVEAINSDFGQRSRHQTLMSDILCTASAIRHSRRNLRSWMRAERRDAGFPARLFGAKARIEFVPMGVIGIISDWNFPVASALGPLSCALAAGNRAMLCFPRRTPATYELMSRLIADAFDPEVLSVVGNSDAVYSAFAAQPFDHLVFTGDNQQAPEVIHATADNLTPTTLVLGGKCPVIISRDCDIDDAALKVLLGKSLNSGQNSLSPDTAYIPAELLNQFADRLKFHAANLFPHVLNNRDYTAIFCRDDYDRLCRLLDEAREHGSDVRSINPAGEDFGGQEANFRLPLTLVVEPAPTLQISREAVQGPVLCLRSYRLLDECFEDIGGRPTAPALYYFGDNRRELRRVLDNCRSAAVTVNDVMSHYSCNDLPFGGAGRSGIGHYRGRDGFREFSHCRSVFSQGRSNLLFLAGLLPPYSEKSEKQLNGMIR